MTGAASAFRLVLDCVRVFLGADPPDRLRQSLGETVDWEAALQIASWHGVTPLVYRVLSEDAGLPADIRRRLHEHSWSIASQNLARAAELRRLLETFRSANIPVVPFKGPALAWLAYGDLSLREFFDLDLLVRSRDVEQIAGLLIKGGYRTELPGQPARRRAYLRSRDEIHFVAEAGGVPIEVHQSVLPRFACFEPDYALLWRRLEPAQLCGAEALALPLEDLLLFLCAHGAKHGWAQLGWICDIAALLSRYGERVNWSRLAGQARSLDAVRFLSLGLLLAGNLTGVRAPEAVMRGAETDSVAQRLAARTEEMIVSRVIPEGLESHRYFLESRERLSTRATYLWRLAFTPTEEDEIPAWLPSTCAPLWHAGRISGKFGALLHPKRTRSGSGAA